jgi:cytosine/adenosine deaminase-related metal-dependent hydrolase
VLFAHEREAGERFIDMLTVNGARSLGQASSGVIVESAPSDLVAVDLNHLSLAGSSPASLPLDLVFSAPSGAITDVWIDAVEVVSEGKHRAERQAVSNLKRVLNRLRTV